MKSIFLADAHLKDPQDQAYRELLTFLHETPEDLDNLFILGDFFDFWHGYQDVVFSPYIAILTALEELSEKGIKIHFFAGNHEISWGPYLKKIGTCYNRESIVELEGQKIYLAHGDRLNPDDHSYLIWSALIRHPWISRIINTLPSSLTWKLAGLMSHSSRNYNGTKKRIPAQVFRSSAKILKGDLKTMVIGHFHQTRREIFSSAHGPKTLYILGDWINDRSYLLLEDGQFSFCSFHQSSSENV